MLIRFTTFSNRLFLCAGLFLATTAGVYSADIKNAGPLFDEFPLTLDTGLRIEAVGPLFYNQDKDGEKTIAFPPLFSHLTHLETESEEFDFAYPLLTYDRYGREFRWQLFQLLSFSGGQNQEEIPKKRFTIFPLYFQQRSPDTEQNYTALIPIYGHLKNRLFRDEIFFVLFPLYGQSRKGDVVTDNYLFPFFHLRHGNSLHGWQFWPLVGNEEKGITTRTNGFGDVSLVPGHEKFFALWPIYFNQKLGIGTTNVQKTVAALPLFNVQRSPMRDSTAVLWPFFNFVDDREKKYHEWQTPWPLVVFARGEGKTTSRIWPLFSQAHNDTIENNFYLWPLYKYKHIHAAPLDRERIRILFFLYSHVREESTETHVIRRREDFWPLFTYHREFNGNTRLQLFAPLEPLLPNNKSIERNYSPLWSIWRSEKNPSASATSQSLLWNLYRRETRGDDKKCSLLFGLFQYQSNAAGKRASLFYIPVVKTKKRTDNGESPQPTYN